MNRRSLLLALLFAPLAAATAQTASPPVLTGYLFYATSGDGSDVRERPEDKDRDAEKFTPQLSKVSKEMADKRFFLMGRHTTPVSERYVTWLKPTAEFPLEIENTGRTRDGGLSLFWKLWQKEREPAKDRELLKTNAVLLPGTPVIIAGPKWRSGRLLFVVLLK